jgi:hypothetical protein
VFFHGISSISVSGVVGINVGEPTGFVFLYLGQLLSWFVGGGKGSSLHPGGAIPFCLLLSVKGTGGYGDTSGGGAYREHFCAPESYGGRLPCECAAGVAVGWAGR